MALLVLASCLYRLMARRMRGYDDAQGGWFTPTRPPAENTAEKQRVRQQMLARNWHDDAISPELGSFCQKSHLIAGLIYLS
jgi:hypothetical protein